MSGPRPFRLCAYNVEWFEELFDDQNRLRADAAPSRREGVSRARQAEAVAHMLRTIDADAVLIVEAPNTTARTGRLATTALENFSAHFGLRQRAAITGFESVTDQELALLFDPDRLSARHDPRGVRLTEAAADHPPLAQPFDALLPPSERPAPAPRFDGVFPVDIDGDGRTDLHVFSRPPLEAVIETATGARFRLIGVHAKSKAPYGAKDEDDAMRIALMNRRKQLAQCVWLRMRAEEHLRAGEDFVILGDFNDGPGLDAYERRFGRSGVDLVMGDADEPEMRLVNPYIRARWSPQYGWRPTTARFYDWRNARFHEALLDFIMLSPGFAARTKPNWRIWHPFDDAHCFADAQLQAALLDGSDHFPVSVDLTL